MLSSLVPLSFIESGLKKAYAKSFGDLSSNICATEIALIKTMGYVIDVKQREQSVKFFGALAWRKLIGEIGTRRWRFTAREPLRDEQPGI
jgi:hypothetical protein